MAEAKRGAAVGSDRSPAEWGAGARWVVSGLLCVHLAAMLAVAFAGSPSSGIERDLAHVFGPYFWSVGLEQTHRYYSPAPPPTPVVTAELTDAGGKTIGSIRLPDRGAWPRLRYQRELALANHLFNDYQNARQAPDGMGATRWGHSYAQHLFARNPEAARIVIRVQQHEAPDPVLQRARARQGEPADPDDPSFYTVPEVVGEYRR